MSGAHVPEVELSRALAALRNSESRGQLADRYLSLWLSESWSEWQRFCLAVGATLRLAEIGGGR